MIFFWGGAWNILEETSYMKLEVLLSFRGSWFVSMIPYFFMQRRKSSWKSDHRNLIIRLLLESKSKEHSELVVDAMVLLMVEILRSPVDVDSLLHYLWGFIHSRWLFGISSINSSLGGGFKHFLFSPLSLGK